MLSRKKTTSKINYLEDWPTHYYDIPTPSLRKEYLEQAIASNLDPDHDLCRMELLKKRFGMKGKKDSGDSFMLAWIMIKSAALAEDNLLIKKQKRELDKYVEDLCLRSFVSASPAMKQVLEEEWTDFARRYILSCIKSKNYSSTFFGIIPLQYETIAKKLADEIDLVTRFYPDMFDAAQDFIPLRRMFMDAYYQLVDDADLYWSE